MSIIDILITSLKGIFFVQMITWMVVSCITIPIIMYGSFKHIIWIDKQLAKDVNKYYLDNGYMKPKYQLPGGIITRFAYYSVTYPWIRKRTTTESTKFKVFMWFNSLGIWGVIGTFLFGILNQ
ncbi:hypothetical protein [Vibrio sp.]|uniref:hypothetical protein n=1 Tax=Vibrio sp. TaxID=678 RepID=UPI00311ED055